MAKAPGRPKLAVWKFASCDGCQLSLLDCEDELLAVAGAVEIAYFPEATRGVLKGPYDISLVEGSVTTAHDLERLKDVRRQSRSLITIGACATAGGIQALRNFKDVKEFTNIVYAHPEYIETLATSTPIGAHVEVDYELRGCPINKHQLRTAASGSKATCCTCTCSTRRTFSATRARSRWRRTIPVSCRPACRSRRPATTS